MAEFKKLNNASNIFFLQKKFKKLNAADRQEEIEMKLFDYETRDGRIDNDKLRSLCIKHDWFTCGTNSQYSKLFEMNEQGAGIEQIATVIWLCSDSDIPQNCRRDIILALHEAGFTERQDKSEAEHLIDWLEI